MGESEAPITAHAATAMHDEAIVAQPVAWEATCTRLHRELTDKAGRPRRVCYGQPDLLRSPQAVAAWLHRALGEYTLSRPVALFRGQGTAETWDLEVQTRLWRRHLHDARAGQEIRAVAREGDQAIEFIVYPMWTDEVAHGHSE